MSNTTTNTTNDTMTDAQAEEWVNNFVRTVNNVVEGKGWDHNDASVSAAAKLVVSEMAARAEAGSERASHVLTMTMMALGLRNG